MTPDMTGKHNKRKAYADAHKTHGVVQSGLDSIWHWLNGVADSVGHFFTSTVANAFKTVWATIHGLVDAYRDLVAKYFSIYYWVQIHVLKYLFHLIMHKYDVAIAKLQAQVRRLIRLIYVTTNQVLAIALNAVRAERRQRIKSVDRAEAKARTEIKAMHQLIEREAASAYQVEYNQRVNTVIRLLEFAVTRDPALRDIVGGITKAILDLVAVDDPLVRLAIGFVVNDLLDKLGVDRLVGTLARDLLAPILGQPKPRDLHAVVLDMGKRLVAAESFQETFTEDGGSEVEQAGRLWRDITNPIAAAGIVAFTATAIADPDGWASALTNTVGKAGNDIVDATAVLIKGA